MTPTPETHVHLGMFRPRYDDLCREHRERFHRELVQNPLNPQVMCRIGDSDHREAWLRGVFDTPVYATRDEIIDRIARGAKDDTR